ncbi:MAG: AMP-binding protein [Pseudomonadaceae bacterium]|nr:AMP-binding protein [Pseudomonadaceae bacterium]
MTDAAANALMIDGEKTVSALFARRVEEDAGKVALREKDFGVWNEYSWADWGERASAVAHGLWHLGLQRGEVCSVAAEVCKEWLFADLGIITAGAVTNGVYPTDASNQVEYLINDSGSTFYFAENEEQLDKVLEVRANTPSLRYIIIFDMEGLRHLDDPMCLSFDALLELGRRHREQAPSMWQESIDQASPDDLMILTYTSGTTGPPKGAMISQRNMLFMMANLTDCLGFDEHDEQLGFLPIAHVAGRMFYVFSLIASRSLVNLIEDPETAMSDLQEVAPSVHFAVPRVWEKQYSMIAIKLKEGTAFGRWAFARALRSGEAIARHALAGERAGLLARARHLLWDKLVLRNVRILLGINSARWLSTAAAPIAPDLIAWYWALGRPMYEIYGQTECTGIATANRPGATRLGSIGKACMETDVVLSEAGEILIRGPGVIAGYWNKPEKTAETIRDGWLHTGDVGRVDEDGYLTIVDRMKDIIITAGGKNITPSEIENQLKFSPFVSDAVVVGDRRPYLTCLVMIDLDNVTKFAQDNNVPFTNYTSLCHAEAVVELIGQEVEAVNSRFARVETVKKFRLIDQLLDAEDEELTPTMKLKRKVVNEKYAELIEAMYR